MQTSDWLFRVNGRPFFPLGGQVHNSSAYTLQGLDRAWKALEAIHANTAEIPVYWDVVEPREGVFDFSRLDPLLEAARQRGLRLILLWFGTWKNGMMKYAPEWVKDNPQRFRRVITPDGSALSVLSPHCIETREADRSAFCAFIQYLKARDEHDHTVIAVQVENEPGTLGSDRDYSPEAEALFREAVPEALFQAMTQAPQSRLAQFWQDCGKVRGDWPTAFGVHASELFGAWHIASYIDSIAEAGKQLYAIPMYVNAWPQEQRWRVPGANYPSGGATRNTIDLWKCAAPHLDVIGLDTYIVNNTDYQEVCAVYNRPDNPLFIPESARHTMNALNMMNALAEYQAIGYAVFGVESLIDAEGAVLPDMVPLANSFKSVRAALPLLIQYRGQVHAVIEAEYRTEQFLDLGEYVALIQFGNADPTLHMLDYAHTATTERGRGLIIKAGEREFYLVGGAYRALFKKKGDSRQLLANATANDYLFVRLANYRRVEEGQFDSDERWTLTKIRNGDETDHGIWVQPDVGVVHVVLGD
jgi:beta-galactosidase GanA